MFKCDFGEINYVKCIVYLVVKGKDIILCPKFHMLEKHVGMTKQSKISHIQGQEGRGD
jgi:hypothetical protein